MSDEPPSPTVFGSDEQSAEFVDLDRWVELATSVLDASGVSAGELSLLFVDETTMTGLNREHMGSNGPTDVLAFPIDDEITAGPDRAGSSLDGVPSLLGDVVICPSVAARQAPEHAGTYDDEIALLVVHGVLHILGMDHAEDAERAEMQARERELLDRFHHGIGDDKAVPGPPSLDPR